MRIKKIKLKNYKCFEDFECEFDNNITVLVGNNGSGKSSILDGLAVALGTWFTGFDGITGVRISNRDAHIKSYNMGETNDVQHIYPVEVETTGIVDNSLIEWKRSLTYSKGQTTTKDAKCILNITKRYQDELRDGNQDLILPVIAYYGTGRLWDYHREKRSGKLKENNKTNGYIDCLSGSANLKLMMNWFYRRTVQSLQSYQINQFRLLNREQNSNQSEESSNQLQTVYNAMKMCLNRNNDIGKISEIFFNLDTNEIECVFIQQDEKIITIPLSQLSDGYKSTISLVADIAYRMSVLNPQLGNNAINLTNGVVLIDEIDLHLHPEWQHVILKDLCSIFPNVQFIVTTHAPAVISSVNSKNIVLLDKYKSEIIDDNNEIFGKDINSLLKEIMHVPSRNPSVELLFNKFNNELNNRNFDKAEEILNEIDNIRKHHDPDVDANRVKLKLERIRRNNLD